ncbi:hypothetical protein GGR56DRAFT_660093 [Xylariaceae sp. FL0804]|nr:hypothetical protein GGR56DRAFT_660093 [Xylariaceae sp. FL0804]
MRMGITPLTVMAPAAAFTMACVMFAYTRSSIKESRRNDQQGRQQRRDQAAAASSSASSSDRDL